MMYMESKGIATRPAACSSYVAYFAKKYDLKPADFPNAWNANDTSVSIPLFHGMAEAEQNRVIDAIKESVLKCVE